MDDCVTQLGLIDIVVAEGGTLQDGGAAHRLLAGPLPDRQRGGRPTGDQPTRPPAPPGREGGEGPGRRYLVGEDRPGPAPRTPEGAAEACADALHEVVRRRGGDPGQEREGGDGARPLLRLRVARRADGSLRQKVGEVRRIRRQERGAQTGRVLLPPHQGGSVSVPRHGRLAASGELEDRRGRGHRGARRCGAEPQGDAQHALRGSVELLPQAGLARAPGRDALPKALAPAGLVERDAVSCGRNAQRLPALYRTSGGPADRYPAHPRGVRYGLPGPRHGPSRARAGARATRRPTVPMGRSG